jgi:very-short-patch-repair endonuclease
MFTSRNIGNEDAVMPTSRPARRKGIRTISPHARSLRANMTDAERALWYNLRDRRLSGFKFKRQWTLGPFVVDFCCLERRLVVEVDGGQHNDEVDRNRTRWLANEGYRVIRFWNNDVLTNLDGVLEALAQALAPDPHP